MLPPSRMSSNRPTYAQIDQALDIVVARAKRAGKIKTSEDGYRRAIRSRWGDDPDQVFEVLNLKQARKSQAGAFPEYDEGCDGAQGDYESRDDRVYLPVLEWMEVRSELVPVLERLLDYESRHGPERRVLLQQRIASDLARAPAYSVVGDRLWTLAPVVQEQRRRFLFGLESMFAEEQG